MNQDIYIAVFLVNPFHICPLLTEAKSYKDTGKSKSFYMSEQLNYSMLLKYYYCSTSLRSTSSLCKIKLLENLRNPEKCQSRINPDDVNDIVSDSVQTLYKHQSSSLTFFNPSRKNAVSLIINLVSLTVFILALAFIDLIIFRIV